MKTLKIFLFSTVILLTGQALATNLKAKAPGDWERLGEKIVNMRADHDVLMVTHHEGFYTKVRFGIRKAPVHIHNIRIVFGNGNDKNIVINKRIEPGTCTRVIDLPGNKRIIRKIKMNYKTVPGVNGRAVFVAWGKH
ncbi:MAG: hypothetical protein ACPG21_13725 [Crocinitomicaceae bacterium]